MQLHFAAGNSTAGNTAAEVVHYGGIGLKNVQRRLELIYPGGYQLDIRREAERFEVKLELLLTRAEAISSSQFIAG
jgi:two-component system LytT family sensor kinase